MVIHEYGTPTARTVLIQPVDEHDLAGMEKEIESIRKLAEDEFRLIAVRIGDWNRELSPWHAPAVFGKEGFGADAAQTLADILKLCEDGSKTWIIGGYSLAGLFALWAAYQTDLFRGVAAASPSVWFPGFLDYMRENGIRSKAVYLSLGDREERTRNLVMATVGDNIREACSLLRSRNVCCILEWNEGNHFRDAELRTAKAFAWVLKQAAQQGEKT